MMGYFWGSRSTRFSDGDNPMALTAIAIKNARPCSKPYELTDERALYLLVNPNGTKYWRLKYRHLGKDKTLALGVWPEVSIAHTTACFAGATARAIWNSRGSGIA